MQWRYIPYNTSTGPENMAIDEMLLEQVIAQKSPNILRFYRWNPTTATIGAHQSLNAEIDMEFAQSEGIDVVRRITGGGAVLHDAINEITYSIICRLSDIPSTIQSPRTYSSKIPQQYHPILESLATGLEHIGVPVDVEKIHCPALLVGGKKISGNAQVIRQNVLLQHGTILLDVDPDYMYKVLKAPIGVSYTKMVQSVRAKVSGINYFVNSSKEKPSLDDHEIISPLISGFEKIFNITFQTQDLTENEQSIVRELVSQKYTKQTWLNKYE